MKTLVGLAVLAACGAAHADENKGFLLAIGAGRATVESDLIDFDADATAYKVTAGWRFNRYLALEASHIDMAEAKQTYADGAVKVSTEGELIQAAVVGTWPLNDYFSLYGRAGSNYFEADARVVTPFGTVALEDDGTEFGWGAGVGAVWDRALFRLEYEKVADQGLDLVSLSIAWRL